MLCVSLCRPDTTSMLEAMRSLPPEVKMVELRLDMMERLDLERLKCWGANDFGQLGLGDTNNRGDEPGEMGGLLPYVGVGTGRTVEEMGLGQAHSCSLLDNQRVKCWGGNNHGQLGLGDTNNRGDQAGEMGDNLPFLNL